LSQAPAHSQELIRQTLKSVEGIERGDEIDFSGLEKGFFRGFPMAVGG